METTNSLNLAPSEQPQQASPAVENNVPTELGENVQPSASGSDAEPALISLLDLPTKASSEDKAKAHDALVKAGILDSNGNPIANPGTSEDCFRFKPQVLLRTMVAEGMIPTYIDENREIHANNVDLLEDNLEDSGSTIYDEPAKVCWATRVLNEGYSIKTFDGKEVTLDTPGVEKYVTILDGQHRTVSCIEKPELNLWVEFPDFDGSPMDFVGRINNMRKGWDGSDIKHSVMTKYAGEVSALEAIEELKEAFKVTDKYAELALTRKKDQFKRSELNEIQLGQKDPSTMAKYTIDPKNKETGWNIMCAIEIAAKDSKQLKKLHKIEFVDGIYNIPGYFQTDTEKQEFERNVAAFICKLDQTKVISIIADIDNRNEQVLFQNIYKFYCNFVNTYTGDKLQEVREECAKAIAAIANDASSKTSSIKKIKVGSPSEVIDNRKEIEQAAAEKLAKQKQKAAEKAAKEAAKAAKKAKTATTTATATV